jgi:hypothetical protein
LRKAHKLRVFENMELRKISGPKREEVTGEWGRLHNGELQDVCFRISQLQGAS